MIRKGDHRGNKNELSRPTIEYENIYRSCGPPMPQNRMVRSDSRSTTRCECGQRSTRWHPSVSLQSTSASSDGPAGAAAPATGTQDPLSATGTGTGTRSPLEMDTETPVPDPLSVPLGVELLLQ